MAVFRPSPEGKAHSSLYRLLTPSTDHPPGPAIFVSPTSFPFFSALDLSLVLPQRPTISKPSSWFFESFWLISTRKRRKSNVDVDFCWLVLVCLIAAQISVAYRFRSFCPDHIHYFFSYPQCSAAPVHFSLSKFEYGTLEQTDARGLQIMICAGSDTLCNWRVVVAVERGRMGGWEGFFSGSSMI